MHLKWMALLLLLPPALAEITSKKFALMPDQNVIPEASKLLFKNVRNPRLEAKLLYAGLCAGSIASRFQCTAICHLKGCLSADYEGGTCTVHTEIKQMGDAGGSYVVPGAFDTMMSDADYVHYKDGRYIRVFPTTEEAGKTTQLCQKPFSYGTRFMIVENADVDFVNDLYDGVFGAANEKKLWIGLTDSVTEGTPRWDDGRDFVKPPGWEWSSGDGSNDGVKDIVFITFKKEPRTWYAEYKTPTDTEEGLVCEVTLQ